MVEKSEAALVKLVARKNQAAFKKLLNMHLSGINRYTVRMIGNAANAEDITQEVFLRLWTRADSYKPEASKLSTWLHNIAHNLCIDYFRKNNRFIQDSSEIYETEENLHLASVSDRPHGIATSASDEPEHELAKKTRDHDVKKALMTLPERQRSAIIMCHYQGVSNKDAAHIMEVSVDALESLLSRGRLKLRKLLTEDGKS
ncbi:sigma-70 family RNA polymerase sigma factor [Pseudomonadales bacterium]|nr:sigma-70 family RNA polymerase sigma factor [Pseudomonadales bacterium]MDC3358262.1 sigma-70 family RNA polymerase sigma factor [Pseudomonadales bacterium]MDG1907868.1 sigma-70 family RNA polymerase sigma factor [Pseudomonadales bacterium]